MTPKQESEKIRPCPFCDQPPMKITPYRPRNGSVRWWVECETKNCHTDGPHKDTKIEAIRSWNGEYFSSQKEISDLKENVEMLREACKLVDEVFDRANHNDDDTNYLGDDEHKAWGKIIKALAATDPMDEKSK